MRWRDDAIAVLVADEKLVVPRKKPDRRRDVAARAWAARDVIEPPPVLVAEGPECRSDSLDRRANPRRRLSRELRDVGDGHRPERRKAPADESLQRVLLRRPPAARDPMARRDVRRIGPAVVPVSAGRRRYEIGVRAPEAPGADDLVACDRRPEFLASKVFESRPKRDIGGRRPLGLQGRETLDRGDDPNARALQEQLSREHRAIEFAEGENGPLAGALGHPRTAWLLESGA